MKECRKRINPKTLGYILLLMHGVWCLSKMTFGEAEYRYRLFLYLVILMPAIGLLWTTAHRLLLSNTMQPETRPPLHRHMLWLLGLIAVCSSLLISFSTNFGMADERAFQQAVQYYVVCGWTSFFQDYPDIVWLGDRHPPLPILLTAWVNQYITHEIQYTSRAVASLLGLGTGILTFRIGGLLFGRRVAVLSSLLLFSIFYFYRFNIVTNNDIFGTFFFTAAVFFLLQLNRTQHGSIVNALPHAFLAGLAISLGLLSKYTVAIIYLFVPVLLFWPAQTDLPFRRLPVWKKERVRPKAMLFLAVLLFSAPLLFLWFRYLISSGTATVQFVRLNAFLGTYLEVQENELVVETRDYLAPWRLKLAIRSLLYDIPSSLGFYLIPLIGLGVWVYHRKGYANHRTWNLRFIWLWIALVFFPIFFALPINRYFMPAYPAVAIWTAFGLDACLEKPTPIAWLALFLSLSTNFIYFL